MVTIELTEEECAALEKLFRQILEKLQTSKSRALKHHPLCSIHSGASCDYDCARDYPQS